jgi:uncharacterized protein YdaT
MLDPEELKKLPPEERIKKLKEEQEKRKKEIKEAQALVDESVMEIEEYEEKKEIPIPQTKSDDMSNLVSEEEREMFRAKRFVSGEKKTAERESPDESVLEEVVEKEKVELPPEAEQKQYGQEEASPLYSSIDSIKKEAYSISYGEGFGEEEEERLRMAQENLKEMEEKYRGTMSQYLANKVSSTQRAINDILRYRRGPEE